MTIVLSGKNSEEDYCKLFSIIDNESFKDFEVILKTRPTRIVPDQTSRSIANWLLCHTVSVA